MPTETLTTKTVHIARGLLPTGPRPRAIISTDDVDAEKDRVIQSGLSFRENLRVTLAHDYRALPVARVIAIHRFPHRTEAEWEWFADDEAAARAKNIYSQGGLDASIGFHVQDAAPNEHGGLDFRRARVVEFALTSVPANERAVALTKSSGRDDAAVLVLAEEDAADRVVLRLADDADDDVRVRVLADDDEPRVTVDDATLTRALDEVLRRQVTDEIARQSVGLMGLAQTAPAVLMRDDDGATVRVEPETLKAAIDQVLGALVHREVRQAINALTGRVD